MSDGILNREIAEVKNERALAQEELKSKQSEFANELTKKGLGEEIKETLANNIEERKREPKRDSAIKRFFRKLARTCG